MSEILAESDLPVSDSLAYWGTVVFVISEFCVFVFLLFAYYYFAIQPRPWEWPPGGLPNLTLSGTGTLLLVASTPAAWFSNRVVMRRDLFWLYISLFAMLALCVAYVILQYYDWRSKSFTFQSAYGSLYYVITGFHVAHALVGILMVVATIYWTWIGYIGRSNNAPVAIVAVYWYFLVIIVNAVFFTLNLTPYLGLTHHVNQ